MFEIIKLIIIIIFVILVYLYLNNPDGCKRILDKWFGAYKK